MDEGGMAGAEDAQLLIMSKPRAQRKESSAGKWTNDEDAALRKIVEEEGPKNWKKVASMLGATRTDVQCLHRWNKVLKPGLHKGTFTSEEDDTLKLMVERAMNENGPDSVKWSSIAEALQGRIGKQCRERWLNHLDPSIKNEDWTGSEIKIMFLAQRFFGNRWKEIAKMLPGRPENTVKNKWNSSFMRSWLKANNLSKGTGESAHLESTEGMASSLHSFEMALKQEGIALESDLAFNCFDYKVEYNVEETKPFVSDSLDVKVYGTTVTSKPSSHKRPKSNTSQIGDFSGFAMQDGKSDEARVDIESLRVPSSDVNDWPAQDDSDLNGQLNRKRKTKAGLAPVEELPSMDALESSAAPTSSSHNKSGFSTFEQFFVWFEF